MIVFINDRKLEVFEGAHLQDAVLAYSKSAYQLLLKGEICLKDERGNGMDSDGRLWEGIQLYIIKK
jgi:hypothetical protein